MAERDPRPTDAANCNWASDGVTYPPSDPGAPKRATGFKPLDVPVPGAGGIIPANDFNYELKLLNEMVTWLRDRGPNEWADIHEGYIDTVSVGQLFSVAPPAAGMRIRGVQLWKITGTATGGGVIYSICTDGDQLYYISGATSERLIVAASADGAEIDEGTAAAGGFTAICTDGLYVYANTTNAGATGLRRHLRGDASEDTSAGSEYACNVLRANGYYCAGVSPVSDAGGIVVWSDIQGTITEDGVAATGSANLAALAIDHQYAYAGGVRSTYDVWALDLTDVATPTWGWRITLPTTTAPTIASIDTDGSFVYVASDRVTLTAGGSANLFILDRVYGQLVATADVPDATLTAANLTAVVVDDEYIYVSHDGTDDCVALKKQEAGIGSGTPRIVAFLENILAMAADGVSLYGRDTADTTKLARHWMAGPTKTFMRAASDDPTRRPFHTLAVPIGA